MASFGKLKGLRNIFLFFFFYNLRRNTQDIEVEKPASLLIKVWIRWEFFIFFFPRRLVWWPGEVCVDPSLEFNVFKFIK